MPAKYSDHPLFALRALLILSATICILLSFFAATGDSYSYTAGPFFFSCFLLFFSGVLAWFDLMTFKIAKATDPDHDPDWPQKRYLILDAIFAIVLQWWFWPLVATVSLGYRSPLGVVEAYAALPVFISSYVIFNRSQNVC